MSHLAPVFRFIYDPALADFELSPEHPFKPLRLELTRSLLEAAELLPGAEVARPAPLDEAALHRVHEASYIAAVRAASQAGGGLSPSQLRPFGLGTSDNPVFAGMHELVSGVCAATVAAVELVASGAAKRAANFAGGLHHAMASRASGFCVYNDLAIGIRHAVDRYGLRVAYVDLDAHHGDGVQELFYRDDAVLTISLHESGRYLFPGTGHSDEVGEGPGRGWSVNLPLEPYTDDDSFLECFELVVPAALEAFAPDLIVLQAGADMHHHDPLADLSLSLAAMGASYRRMVELADACCGGRLVVTGGGGYDPYRTVPRAWARAWAELSLRQLPVQLPARWRRQWSDSLGTELPETSGEDSSAWPIYPHRAAVAQRNRESAEQLLAGLGRIWASPARRS